jgi:hypothetical protein
MAITGVTEQQYREFLFKGGDLTFEIDSTEIYSSGQFEKSPLIEPFIFSGFELRPSPIIDYPKEAAQILLHGDSWTSVVTTQTNK